MPGPVDVPADASNPAALTAPALRLALVAGARRVIAARDALNRINVFPVADGDTGSNLAHTLGSLLNGALGRRSRHIGQLLTAVGDEAIDGARGNSGAILAQFLYGLAEHARNAPVLDSATLAAAVRRGADGARAALAHPVEGTILSVIDAFADALDDAARTGGNDPRAGFATALLCTRRALAATPSQMPLLRRAGVVDAGAQGFVDLLEGIAEFVDGGPRAMRIRGGVEAVNDGVVADAAALAHDDCDPEHRWCTECLLLGNGIRREVLRDALDSIDAESLVLAGGATRMRVHAHVASPQRLFDACAQFGTVESMKADDMLMQQISQASAVRVAIATDSAADLPEELAQRLAIHVVPVRVSVDGRDYLDKVGLSTAEFYRRMAASAAGGNAPLPTTSQPSPGDFRRSFEFLLAHHPQLLYIGVSRAVSGTVQAAEHVAQRLGGDRIRVFDSVNAAGGQALLAWRAAELAAAGRDMAEIAAELERLRPLTLTWAMARDISHAVRGGRIPAWAGPMVRLSGLTPVARFRADGRLGVAAGLLARRRAPEVFARYLARRLSASTRWRLIVGHCDALADGERVLWELSRRLLIAQAHLVETGPAIGAHAGRGALVVSLQPAPDQGR
ncbi:DegV family protein [Montanilutibacter psychrotolerans]|nr:DegV family protein [Lysobacter psychrotolerans]